MAERRAARELRRVPAHGGEGLGLDGEAEPRGEADGAQRPDRILLHPDLGVVVDPDVVRTLRRQLKLRFISVDGGHTAEITVKLPHHEMVSREARQKGSYVGPEKLTFDFNCAPLTGSRHLSSPLRAPLH